MTHRPLIGLIATLALLLGGAACGNTDRAAEDDPSASGSPSQSPSESAPAGPSCAAVWVTGNKLPADYEFCIDESGAVVEDELIECSSGQVIVVHGNEQYAVAGGKITAAANVNKDPRFRKILRVCKG